MNTKQGNVEGEDRHATLLNNAGAVRAICSAVEGTLGPKGLDTMLVGQQGDVLITNDGVTILEKMDVSHPAARLLVQVARSQQALIGDGTTTATVLAGALVSEGVAQVVKGVPVAKVVAGLELGIKFAAEAIAGRSRPVEGPDDPVLSRIAYIAGREHEDIAGLVVQAARLLGAEKLKDERFRFADAVTAVDRGRSEVWPGLLLNKLPLSEEEGPVEGSRVLLLLDPLEAERPDEEVLGTEAGYRAYAAMREQFLADLEKLAELGVGLIALDRGAGAEAEQFCADRGIMLLPRVPRRDLQRLAAFTAAKPLRRTALRKSAGDLAASLGRAGRIAFDGVLERVRLADGAGTPAVTVVVGASTREVAGERSRIAKDAASAVQAAVRGGCVAGGGAAELAAARELERFRETVKGLEGFGLDAVSQALRKPLAQIVINAGFNPLEKVEEARAAQAAAGSDTLGIDCDTGRLTDMIEALVIDPAPVKIHAIQAAGEVAAAVLRIHTVIKMKQGAEPQAE
ncbi:TCP-1/cpn60 chaperonin family protein [Paenibacillus aurantius]|uniref:TCP-1/cpn60 chaperonin family protein n=1 Tax=Paenibacillus aurantius TaxID=2918900 RepID=A0AA96RHD5_9BACL|nr:TCP-1/cpn60 chaperonin family protein [Paenibacillus aurantius]WNQ13436.1 TCP-1/cpn60 chaperonin family protein [Paenibacillus aurantius]